MAFKEVIAAIDLEISQLEKAKSLLSGIDNSAPTRQKPGPKPGTKTAVKRVLSPEARARIAAAQKKRWAAQKKAGKQ